VLLAGAGIAALGVLVLTVKDGFSVWPGETAEESAVLTGGLFSEEITVLSVLGVNIVFWILSYCFYWQ
jgi:hypothetical protein